MTLLPVQDTPGYFVSAEGRVWSEISRRWLKPALAGVGYWYLNVGRKNGGMRGRYIHRLVAEAFIPNPDGRPTVNHKDRNRLNNAADNLEWATYEEQQAHWRQHGSAVLLCGC